VAEPYIAREGAEQGNSLANKDRHAKLINESRLNQPFAQETLNRDSAVEAIYSLNLHWRRVATRSQQEACSLWFNHGSHKPARDRVDRAAAQHHHAAYRHMAQEQSNVRTFRNVPVRR